LGILLPPMTENLNDTRKWYQKKRYIIPASIVGLVFFVNAALSDTYTPPASQNLQSTTVQPITVPVTSNTAVSKPVEPNKVEVKTTAVKSEVSSQTLSNDNYYTNVNGNQVHSPAYSSGGIPSGASAQCRDGTYSFSQNRRGTCSGHGGVASWL